MVSAINFAVRGVAGSAQQGTVAGENQSNLIAIGSGQSISLNLSPGSVVAYKQQGSDLVIQLVDGRSVVLSDYFAAPAGSENKLYLSSNDEIIEVRVNGGVDGVLFADYGPVEVMDKWSPLDDLRFSQSDVMDEVAVASNEPAGMAMLLPGLLAGGAGAGVGGLGAAAALAGGAVLLGGGSGGGGTTTGGGTGGGTGGTTPTRIPPTVDPAPVTTLTTNTTNPTVTVTGNGQPGDTVVVTVGGKVETATIGTNGEWTVTYTGTNLPTDGTHTANVVVTNTSTNGTTTLTGPTYVIDMTPPTFTIDDGTTAVGDLHNIASYVASNGMTVLNGHGEAGATISVSANGYTRTATVGSNGTWSVSFTQAQLPGGEYHEVPVTVRSTDIHGNISGVTNATIAIDTVANPINLTSVGGDGTVNMAESVGGFAVIGTSLPFANMVVNIGGVVQNATADATGRWTANFGGGIMGADGNASVIVSSTDAAGNANSQTFRFRLDTVASVDVNTVAGNNIVSAAENGAAIAVNGTSEIGTTSVSVTWGGQTMLAAVNAATGAWSVNFPANLFGAMQATATTMQVRSVDAYGNIGTDSHLVTVDTMAAATIGAVQIGDNKINAAEAMSGVVLSGVSDANASVLVNFEGQNITVMSDANGAWNATFTLPNLGAVERSSTITVIATDANGNVSPPATHSVSIDTLAPADPFVSGDYGVGNVIGGVSTEAAAGDYSYFAVGATGAASQLSVIGTLPTTGHQENGANVTSEFAMFSAQVPDGSYLVIRDVDTAGNESSTMYLRSTGEVNVDLSRAGLSSFDFGTIDLTSADANLTLNAATIMRLTGADHQMTVTGNSDDVVNLAGGTLNAATVNAHGETYKLYTLAGGASVLIDDDITVNLTV